MNSVYRRNEENIKNYFFVKFNEHNIRFIWIRNPHTRFNFIAHIWLLQYVYETLYVRSATILLVDISLSSVYVSYNDKFMLVLIDFLINRPVRIPSLARFSYIKSGRKDTRGTLKLIYRKKNMTSPWLKKRKRKS